MRKEIERGRNGIENGRGEMEGEIEGRETEKGRR